MKFNCLLALARLLHGGAFRSWWNRSPLVISTTGQSAAMAATALRMPSISSTGCCSVSRPISITWCRSRAAMRPSVSSMAASIIDSTMPLAP